MAKKKKTKKTRKTVNIYKKDKGIKEGKPSIAKIIDFGGKYKKKKGVTNE